MSTNDVVMKDSFMKNLRMFRISAGLTLNEMSDICKTYPAALSKYERGKLTCGNHIFNRIFDGLADYCEEHNDYLTLAAMEGVLDGDLLPDADMDRITRLLDEYSSSRCGTSDCGHGYWYDEAGNVGIRIKGSRIRKTIRDSLTRHYTDRRRAMEVKE